jgi:dienelactone hydrolase
MSFDLRRSEGIFVGAVLTAIRKSMNFAAKAAPICSCYALILTTLSIPALTLNAQTFGEQETGEPGDAIIHAYLGTKAARIHNSFMDGIQSATDWEKRRPDFEKEYLYMLGLDPLPEKTPLSATITGSLEGDGFVVEMIHYQSSPGLYVTGNLYRPSTIGRGEKLPAILYVCGHSPRGRNGNKTAYQSHGIWFARNGYVCLMIDTLQMGEIEAIHHGTKRYNRWWWHSRGYTSAGVEAWNGIRGIDYLTTRSDVDPDRIGVTGISGGGAATFWIAAADKRVKVAVPVSGMADLPSYVPNLVVNGHCDCMFLYNTFQWPWTRIAALIAPRPLLFVNSDNDRIFPMDANKRVINRLEYLYSLFGAGDQVDSVVSMGGHAYREDIRKATYRFLNIHLKNDPSPVKDSEVDLVVGPRGQEVHPIPPEKLRVFPNNSDIPEDELNTSIDQHFVPVAKVTPPTRGAFVSWKKNLTDELRRVTFHSFPERIPSAKFSGTDRSGALKLQTESGIEVRLREAPESPAYPKIKRIILVVNSGDNSTYPAMKIDPESDVVYFCDPRGVGDTRWTVNPANHYVARSYALLGRTVDDGRVWDIAATARFLVERYDGEIPLTIAGKGAGAVLGAYAMLLEPDINGAFFEDLPASHMKDTCPPLLNILRVCDVPDVLGSLAPRPLSIHGIGGAVGEKIAEIYKVAGAEEKLRIE